MDNEEKVEKGKRWKCILNIPHQFLDDGDLRYMARDVFERHLQLISADFGALYWAIMHDIDKDDNGEFKTIHYHLVIEFGSRRTKNKVLDILCDYLGLPTECVSVRKSENKVHDLRYLLHMDDLNKAVYLPSDIMTNRFTDFNVAMNTSNVIDVHELIDVCERSKGDYLQVCRMIGLENAKKYHFVIREIMSHM